MAVIGGINLGNLTNYLFFFEDGSTDANWQGASKGYVGDVAVNGLLASERTSGFVPYAGTIFTNAASLGPWQAIVDDNPTQASEVTNDITRISNLRTDLKNAFQQIIALPPSPGFESVSSASLNGLNTQNGINETFVINVTSGLTVSSKIFISGDPGDVYILRWDTDLVTPGFQGQVKFQSGGAIVPQGGLIPSNFINVAGDINASGGGTTPLPPYPQGPRFNNGLGPLIQGGSDFTGGGFFTGYWLTTGAPTVLDPFYQIPHGDTQPLSNGIFVGGWYTITTKFSLTSGSSGVYVAPNPATTESPSIALQKFISPNGGLTFVAAPTPPGPAIVEGTNPVYLYRITNTGNTVLSNIILNDDVLGAITLATTTLLPGESTEATITGIWVAGQQTNTATVQGTFNTTTVSATSTANYFGVMGLCMETVHEAVCVQAEVTISPGVTVGAIESFCVGSAVIGACPGTPATECTFTVSQNICVQVPLTFSAEAAATPSGIVCGAPASGPCVL